MKTLLVFAHCDDEVIWGFPWLCNEHIERRVLICSSDRLNRDREHGKRGEEALEAVCRAMGVSEFRCLGQFQSEFYRLPARGTGITLREWWHAAEDAVREMSQGCDCVVTHNPWGEYGHHDHLLVRRMVLEHVTDQWIEWNGCRVDLKPWPIGNGMMNSLMDYLEMNPADEFQEQLEKLKAEYVQRGAWTWDFEIPDALIYRELR